jgi:AraC family ethanolamine operon transcriptional activator
MDNDAPTPLLAAKTFRFTDADEFRSWVRHINMEVTPLARTFAAEQVILNLQDFAVNLIKSFPRIADVELASNCTAVGFSMDDGVPVRFNGLERDQSVIAIGHNGAAYSAVARTERQYVSIIFRPAIDERGWPESGPNFSVHQTSSVAHQRLRALVNEILLVSRTVTDPRHAALVSAAIKESVLAGIDAAFAEVVAAKSTSRANSARQFKIFQDIRELLAANISNPVYSGELAKQLGISVRSIHDAVLRYSGMSLHRYLRLRRLWLVRRQLLAGAETVKACALAFGFWHMGDFSHSYRFQFGETPSETLAKARKSPQRLS